MAIDCTTVYETVTEYAHLHHLVFLMCVDTNVVYLREAIVEAKVGNSAMFPIGGKAVNDAIFVVVEPSAFNNIVGGIVAYAKHESSHNTVDGVLNYIVNIVFDVVANVLY